MSDPVQQPIESTLFRFLDLPKDVRFMVYERLPRTTKQTSITTNPTRADDNPHALIVTLVSHSTPTSILSTCHQISEEASPFVNAAIANWVIAGGVKMVVPVDSLAQYVLCAIVIALENELAYYRIYSRKLPNDSSLRLPERNVDTRYIEPHCDDAKEFAAFITRSGRLYFHQQRVRGFKSRYEVQLVLRTNKTCTNVRHLQSVFDAFDLTGLHCNKTALIGAEDALTISIVPKSSTWMIQRFCPEAIVTAEDWRAHWV